MALYAILSVSQNASFEELRKNYKALCLSCHPDKHGGDTRRFQELQKAWDILKDPQSRTLYDHTLVSSEKKIISEQVDLDDMSFREAGDTFIYPCRCGEQFIITSNDLDAGITVIQCSGCSLCIEVLYNNSS